MITVALPGDYGKPRPAVVVQNDQVGSDSTIVCLLSSDPTAGATYRQLIVPNAGNGLREPTFAMTEKIQLAKREKCGPPIGRLAPDEMAVLDVNLTFVLGIGD